MSSAWARRRWRAVVRWLHVWLGAAVSLVVLAVGLSGMALAFVSPLFAWETGALSPAAERADGPRAPVGVLADAAVRHFDGAFEPLGILMPGSRLEVGAAAVYGTPTAASGDETGGGAIWLVGVDPASGEVLGSFDLDATLSHQLLHFHEDLLLGETGKIVVAVVALLLAGLAVSGVVLWWPARGRLVRQVRRDASAVWRRPSQFSLHRTAGVWGGVLVVAWGLSGAYWSKPDWFAPLLDEAWQDLPAAERARFADSCFGTVSPTAAERTARRAFPDLSLATMTFAGGAFDHHRLSLKGPGSLDPYAGDSVLWVHATCAGVFHVRQVKDARAGAQVAHLLPALHSGRLFGAAGRPLVLLVGALTVLGALTGLVLWYRRYRRRFAAAFGRLQ